jgi:predicted transcriptional regulator
MNTISLKISASLQRRLSALSAEAGVSRSELLRRALEDYLARDDSVASGSIAALAGDLAGCFSGPADLSTSPDHMADYGR